jgi:hypothetical protein
MLKEKQFIVFSINILILGEKIPIILANKLIVQYYFF